MFVYFRIYILIYLNLFNYLNYFFDMVYIISYSIYKKREKKNLKEIKFWYDNIINLFNFMNYELFL